MTYYNKSMQGNSNGFPGFFPKKVEYPKKMINFFAGYIIGGFFTFLFLYIGFRIYEYRNDDEC